MYKKWAHQKISPVTISWILTKSQGFLAPDILPKRLDSPKIGPNFLAHKSHQKPRARQPQHAHRIDRHEGAHKDFSYKWSADHLGNSWLHVKPILRYVEILYLHHVQVQTYSTYNYIWSYKYVPIYVYIYIYNVLISEMYLSIYGLLTHIEAPHHLPGKFLQVTAPMVVVMVIKTDKATSPPANKAKRFEADPGSEVRIVDYWIDSKYSLITCFVDVFVALWFVCCENPQMVTPCWFSPDLGPQEIEQALQTCF